jgi:hypothetical protein
VLLFPLVPFSKQFLNLGEVKPWIFGLKLFSVAFNFQQYKLITRVTQKRPYVFTKIRLLTSDPSNLYVCEYVIHGVILFTM